MNAEMITMLLGFATLVGVQIRTTLALITRMDRQSKEIGERIDRETTQVSDRIDRHAENSNTRFDEMNKRFDQVNRELADQRERMAKLEGSLDGFLAGRRDRDAA